MFLPFELIEINDIHAAPIILIFLVQIRNWVKKNVYKSVSISVNSDFCILDLSVEPGITTKSVNKNAYGS